MPGPYDSPESRAAYYRLCQHVDIYGELPPVKPVVMTITELGAAFTRWAESHYTDSDEPTNLSYAVQAMTKTFPDLPAESFGPPELKTVRASLIAAGQCRNTANKRAKMIVAVFRWAVEEGHVSESVWARLKAVRPIAFGRDGAIDYEAVGPVSRDHFAEASKMVPPRYRPALDVQRMTGMRSGELLAMRPQDVDMTGKHWYYRPARHKTRSHVRDKIVGIPAPATEILRGCMPRDWSERWFPWAVDTHYHAVQRACGKADIPRWHPHQLRHCVATLCDQIFGEQGKEAARLMLAHTDARTTGRYIMPTPETLEPILDRLSQSP